MKGKIKLSTKHLHRSHNLLWMDNIEVKMKQDQILLLEERITTLIGKHSSAREDSKKQKECEIYLDMIIKLDNDYYKLTGQHYTLRRY